MGLAAKASFLPHCDVTLYLQNSLFTFKISGEWRSEHIAKLDISDTDNNFILLRAL